MYNLEVTRSDDIDLSCRPMIYNNPDVNGNSCDEDTSLSVDTVSDDNVTDREGN